MAGRTPGTKRRTNATNRGSNRGSTHRRTTVARRATFAQVTTASTSVAELIAEFRGKMDDLEETSQPQYIRGLNKSANALIKGLTVYGKTVNGWSQHRSIDTMGQGREKAAAANAGR